MKNLTLFSSPLRHFSSSGPVEPVFLSHLWYFLLFSSPFVRTFHFLALFSGCSSAPYTPCSIDNSTKRLLCSLMFFPVAGMFIICFSTCKVHYRCSCKVIIFVLPFQNAVLPAFYPECFPLGRCLTCVCVPRTVTHSTYHKSF